MEHLSKTRIALVCTGLGREKRGFESFTESLFQALRQQAPFLDVTLFQGGGKKEDRRISVPNLSRYSQTSRWLGLRKAYILETRSFALALYPFLRWGHYDIVHYNDLTMGSALYHLRRYLGGKFKLLYCNGAPSPPVHYHHRCEFAQMLTGPMYEEARAFGLAEDRLFLIPYGVDAQRFSPGVRSRRSAVRQELRIPEGAKVVLTVAALKKEHKRVDYLIREIAQLEEPVWFLAAGQRTDETSALEEEARDLLPQKWRFISWPYEQMHLLYGAADVFVLASLVEGFGLVTVEALLSGLPVVIHASPENRWLVDDQSPWVVDLAQEGNLARTLKDLFITPRKVLTCDKTARRFSWESLIPEYMRMYAQVAQTPFGS